MRKPGATPIPAPRPWPSTVCPRSPNNFMIDGIDNNESLVNTIVIFPAIEDIAEFRTTTSTPPG